MPYLSRIWINPLRKQGRHLLESPQAMHAAVLGGLPAEEVSERVLWRVDAEITSRSPQSGGSGSPFGRRPGLLVLTRSRPSWEHLVEQAGWPGSDTPETPQAEVRDYAPLLERLDNGQSYRFRLTANPVQSVRRSSSADGAEEPDNGTRPRSQRKGHRTVEHQLGWLVSRVSSWGFEIPPARAAVEGGDLAKTAQDVRIVARDRRTFRRRPEGSGSGGRQVTLQVVTFEGHLKVADAETLRGRLLSGCGPAKAYGCGLLTLAPSTTPPER